MQVFATKNEGLKYKRVAATPIVSSRGDVDAGSSDGCELFNCTKALKAEQSHGRSCTCMC